MYRVSIDWRAVWKEFEVWFNEIPRTWTNQKRKLRQLVEKHSNCLPPDYQHD